MTGAKAFGPEAVAMPMGPAPVTSTRAPTGSADLRTPSSPTASGSDQGAFLVAEAGWQQHAVAGADSRILA